MGAFFVGVWIKGGKHFLARSTWRLRMQRWYSTIFLEKVMMIFYFTVAFDFTIFALSFLNVFSS